jgi:hypothetical protein
MCDTIPHLHSFVWCARLAHIAPGKIFLNPLTNQTICDIIPVESEVSAMKCYLINKAQKGWNAPMEETTIDKLESVWNELSEWGHCEIIDWADDNYPIFCAWEE